MKKKITTLALRAILLALCSAAPAQETKKIPRIGLLTLLASPDPPWEAFAQGLRELGYIEGQNITMEYRRAAGKVERLPRLAEVVRLKVDLMWPAPRQRFKPPRTRRRPSRS